MKNKDYRLIEKNGVEVEITDSAVVKIHFIGRDIVVITRKYKDGESVAKYNNFSESFYDDNEKLGVKI